MAIVASFLKAQINEHFAIHLHTFELSNGSNFIDLCEHNHI